MVITATGCAVVGLFGAAVGIMVVAALMVVVDWLRGGW
jgi:hypothetical protein